MYICIIEEEEAVGKRGSTWGRLRRGGRRLKEFNVDVPRPRLVVRVDVSHEGVAGAVDAFADHAPVLLLSLCVLIGDVSLQGCFGAEHLAAQLAREHLLGRRPCNTP